MDFGSNAFILICAALVFLMTPGLAFFYGGLTRRKNVINTMAACGAIMGVTVVLWILIGFSLSFGADHGGIIGGFEYICLNGLDFETALDYAPSLSSLTYVVFQMMFAMITAGILTGSVAGRMKFKALFFFIILWSFAVYYPLAHMVWGADGFLASIGSVDFAGGNVVHISSGVSGLVLALLLGRRRGVEHAPYRPHNVPYVFLGAGLLWFGWFGFNAGSALEANGLAAHAFTTTAVASATAMLVWMLLDVIKTGKPTLVGISTGLVAGLVAITPGAGYVPVWSALIIGAGVSPLCFFGISLLKQKLKIDDALDAFGCHGIGGIWGGIATGLFARSDINSVAQWDGLVFGDVNLFLAQLAGIGISIAVAVVGTLICAGIVRIFTKLRVEPKEELIGMDTTQHGENAYPSFNGLD